MERDELQALYDAALKELGELGEVWLEFRVIRRNTVQVDRAIGEVTRESRRYEKKLRKAGWNAAGNQPHRASPATCRSHATPAPTDGA
jgi:hypothetical protein